MYSQVEELQGFLLSLLHFPRGVVVLDRPITFSQPPQLVELTPIALQQQSPLVEMTQSLPPPLVEMAGPPSSLPPDKTLKTRSALSVVTPGAAQKQRQCKYAARKSNSDGKSTPRQLTRKLRRESDQCR